MRASGVFCGERAAEMLSIVPISPSRRR